MTPGSSPDATLVPGVADGTASLHVLLIDDDEVDRLAVKRALRRAGLNASIDEAAGATAGRDAVARTSFDCVFLDYNLPGSDGLQVLGWIRDAQPGTPVIMLTGQGDEQVAVDLMKAGAVDYLPKANLTPERLASSVRYALELGRASRLAHTAERELRDSADRARFLAEASAVLTRSLDPRETIGEVAHMAVPFLADYCLVYRVDREGNPSPVAMAHADPDRMATLQLVADRHRPANRDDDSAVARAIRTGETVLVQPVTDEFLAAAAGDDEVLAAFRELDPATVLAIPLTARQRIRGALLLCRVGGRSPFTAADVELAEDLARRTALAFDNAGLYEAAHRERRRTERLQRVTASLASSVPSEQVAGEFVEQVTEALHADTAWVAVLNDDRDTVTTLAHTGFEPAEIEPWLSFSADLPVASRDVLADGEDRWFETAADLQTKYPTADGAPARIPQEALGMLALDVGEGPFGVMTVGYRDPQRFAAEDKALARALASQFAQALERGRLYEAERAARERAEAANRSKSEFLARMSHDLRTPLNAIGGYAEIVEMGLHGPVTEQQQDAMRRIQRAKDHLLTLINDILNFAKLEAGQVTIRIEDVDVNRVLREIGALIEPQVHARALEFVEQSAAGLRARVDAERLEQVLLNLLTNAVKFTDTGTVSLEAEAEGDEVVIRVRDTGRGIPPERLSTIFDPFIQAGDSTVERREGVGLGLAISRELLRLMGGTLHASSTEGVGSEFTVRLPRS